MPLPLSLLLLLPLPLPLPLLEDLGFALDLPFSMLVVVDEVVPPSIGKSASSSMLVFSMALF